MPHTRDRRDVGAHAPHSSPSSTHRAVPRTVLLAVAALIGALLHTQRLEAQARSADLARSTSTAARPGAGGTLARTSLFGALTGSVLAMGYYFMSERGERSNGCQPLNCALPFLTSSGAIAGLFIGRELDAQRRAFAPRAGEAIDFGFAEARVLAPPTYIDVRDSLMAVVSDSGAQILSVAPEPKALRRRANGLSAMRQIAIVPSRSSIVLGTGTALWEANLVSGPASRLADGAVDALATSDDAVLSATGRVLRLRVGAGESARTDSLIMAQPVSALLYDAAAKHWWVASDSQIVQVSSENAQLRQTSMSLATPTAARAIAVNDQWIAAALGDEGIIAWPRSSVGSAAVTPLRVVQEPRFAYDLAFLDGVLFVAGGVDGLFQISLTPTARVVGSSRQVRFATSVRAGNGVLWIGDRNRESVVRFTP